MTQLLRVRCAAKLNLFLEVLGRRPDGYREIETVFQEISIFDDLEIERTEGEKESLDFSCSIDGLAPPGENLVEKAVDAFRRAAGPLGALRIRLEKRIPDGSGLGGGSSDAAATLVALRTLTGRSIPLDEIAAKLGSDCAFFLRGGSALGRGRGEILTPLELPARGFLVVVPPVKVSTAAVYAALSPSLMGPSSPRTISADTLRSPELSHLAPGLFNRLETAAFKLHPELRRIATQMAEILLAPVFMTGSGGALFSVFDRLQTAEIARRRWIASAAGASTASVFAAETVAARTPF